MHCGVQVSPATSEQSTPSFNGSGLSLAYPDIPALCDDAMVMLDVFSRAKILSHLARLEGFPYGGMRIVTWNVGVSGNPDGLLIATDTHLLYYADRGAADFLNPDEVYDLKCFHGFSTAQDALGITLVSTTSEVTLCFGHEDPFRAVAHYLERHNWEFQIREKNFKEIGLLCARITSLIQTQGQNSALQKGLQHELESIYRLHDEHAVNDLVLIKAFDWFLKQFCEDKELSLWELRVLFSLLLKNIEQPYENFNLIDKLRAVWHNSLVNSGYLMPVETTIVTHGELVYQEVPCKVIEHKTIRERRSLHGGISIPITKGRGPRIYLGGSKPVSWDREVDVTLGRGVLLITDKRLLFIADNTNTFDLRLSYIHNIEAYLDGFELHCTRKQRDYTYVLENQETTEQFLTVLRKVLSGDLCRDPEEVKGKYGAVMFSVLNLWKAEIQKKLGKWVDMDFSLEYTERDPIAGTGTEQRTAIVNQLVRDLGNVLAHQDPEGVESECAESLREEGGGLATQVLRQIISAHFETQIRQRPEIAITNATYQKYIVDPLLPRLREIDGHRDWQQELAEFKSRCFVFREGKLQFDNQSLGYWNLP